MLTVFRRCCLVILLSIQTIQPLAAGQYQVTGRVLDSKTGKPIHMANVFLANTFKGCATNADGFFEINNVPRGSYDLVVHHIAYPESETHHPENDSDSTTAAYWLKEGKLEEERHMWSIYTLEPFKKAVLIDPNHEEVYQKYIQTVVWLGQEKEELTTIQSLSRKTPNQIDRVIDLAAVYQTLEMIDKSYQLLDSLESILPVYTHAYLSYVRAKNHFIMEEDSPGETEYWRALSAVSDSVTADWFYQDIGYITKLEEYEELITLHPSGILDFYKKFWISRDPDLSTQANERIPEHFRRLFRARREYRRYTPRSGRKYIHWSWPMYNPRRFQRSFFKPEIESMRSALSPLPERLDLDDMGLIFVRHGEPDNWAFTTGNEDLNLSWRFDENKFREKLVFHFLKSNGFRGWTLQDRPKSFRNRGDMGIEYRELDMAASDPDYNPPIGNMINDITIVSYEDGVIGISTETTDYEYEEETLDFPVQLLAFKGDQGKTRLELYYGLSGNQITPIGQAGQNNLNFWKFVTFFDESWEEQQRLEDSVLLPIPFSVEEWQSKSLVDMIPVLVSAGHTHFEFHLKDLGSGKRGVYRGLHETPDYFDARLEMSDILISRELDFINKRGPFQKGDVNYYPHMFVNFQHGETIGIYAELYNLTYDQEGQTQYKIEYTLQEAGADKKRRGLRRLFSRNKSQITSSFVAGGKKRDERITINYDSNKLEKGKYELVFSAVDLNMDTECRKKVDLEIE